MTGTAEGTFNYHPRRDMRPQDDRVTTEADAIYDLRNFMEPFPWLRQESGQAAEKNRAGYRRDAGSVTWRLW